MYLRIFLSSIILILLFSSTSCLNDKLDDQCEVSYYTVTVKPIFITNCANSTSCHVTEGAAGSDYSKYTDVFADKDEIVRRISLDTSDPDFMPKGGLPLSFEDIKIINDWVASGAQGCDN